MTYGQRLKQSLEVAGKDRKSLAVALGVSPQAIGMVITGTGGLSFENNLKAAKFLGIDPEWLKSGGIALVQSDIQSPKIASPSYGAQELGALFDMIPEVDRIRRTKAFNAASVAILEVIQSAGAASKSPPSPDAA